MDHILSICEPSKKCALRKIYIFQL